jgi:hypothetical protein
MKRTLLVLILAACGTDAGPASECSPGETLECDCSATSAGIMTCSATGEFGTCGQCSIPDPDPVKANFQAQIVPIFNKSCGAGDSGCHARNAYFATSNRNCRGWLSFENASLGSTFDGMNGIEQTGCPDMSLYTRLMTLAVWQCSNDTTPYVKAGDMAGSYIMNKINGTNLCDAGNIPLSDQVMPPPASAQPNPQNPYTLSAADKALIEQWITEGALDN